MNPNNSVPTPQASVPAAPPQLTAAPIAPPVLQPTVPVHPTSDPQVSVVAPAVADDGDLIEKEWVHKAKQIVERTRLDPHQQTKEMHAFRAEYMKKRYNKVIEPVEE